MIVPNSGWAQLSRDIGASCAYEIELTGMFDWYDVDTYLPLVFECPFPVRIVYTPDLYSAM